MLGVVTILQIFFDNYALFHNSASLLLVVFVVALDCRLRDLNFNVLNGHKLWPMRFGKLQRNRHRHLLSLIVWDVMSLKSRGLTTCSILAGCPNLVTCKYGSLLPSGDSN